MERKAKNQKVFTLPVTWELCGFVKIRANNLTEAMEKFRETSDNIALPENGEYVDGSFSLSSEDEQLIKFYN